jgi:hypothetical protein
MNATQNLFYYYFKLAIILLSTLFQFCYPKIWVLQLGPRPHLAIWPNVGHYYIYDIHCQLHDYRFL